MQRMEKVALNTSIIKTALEKCPEYEEGKRLESGTSRFKGQGCRRLQPDELAPMALVPGCTRTFDFIFPEQAGVHISSILILPSSHAACEISTEIGLVL
jgi:hypothetical protein